MYRTPYLSEMKNLQLYGPKYNNFRANCTAVFVCVCFFLYLAVEILLNMLFNTLLKNTKQYAKKKKKKRKTKVGNLHDDIRSGSPIQSLTPPDKA